MWTVIYISNTRQDADNIKEVLVAEGFLIKIKPINENDKKGACEILVPRAEAEECHSALFSLGL
ncbi:MAG: hypothetical protein ACOCG5_02120 [Candidatus Alkaliphilus sp. MAG34]|nr:hypothetical protein [Clostridiales bacterium]